MCLNPILRPNPNWNGKSAPRRAPSYRTRIAAMMSAYGKDVDNSQIYVPCGHCCECVQAKQNQLVQRIQSEAQYNHLFFCTLTYDNKHLPRLHVEVPRVSRESDSRPDELPAGGLFPLELIDAPSLPEDVVAYFDERDRQADACLEMASSFPSGSSSVAAEPPVDPLCNPDVADPETGELLTEDYDTIEIPYADIHHIQLLMKNLRDNNPCDGRNLRYVCVSELGKANGRPHFHILFLVEKRPGDFELNQGVYEFKQSLRYSLEKSLWQAVFKYWAINVGTRKNPVYEKLFTYRKRFYGQRLYTNFDLHYVDPKKTTGGSSNVAYYVSKYILKGSDRERRRQQFLRLNLDEEQYRACWDTIKCRLLMSKGLGLDARFYTVEKHVEESNPDFCTAYANRLRDIVSSSDDLPSDDLELPSPVRVRVVSRRIMVPNFELSQIIRHNLTRDVGLAPGPIFISPDGKHRPLAHYYQTKSWIFTDKAFLDIYLNYDDTNDIPHWELPKERKDALELKHTKRLSTIDNNSTFDTSPALLFAGSDPDQESNRYRCYGL